MIKALHISLALPCCHLLWTIHLRDWSLITGRGGGYKTGGGGAREVLPLRKGGGAEKSLCHSEGGAQNVLG